MADTSTSTAAGHNDQQLQQLSSSFHPPSQMRIDGVNIEESWKNWIQKFELFLLASRAENLPDKNKVAMFLSSIGDEGLHIYNTFVFDDEALRDNYATVKQKFVDYCSPHKNVVFERYNFWKTTQSVGETIDAFVTTLRLHAKTCQFEQHRDSMLRDRIVLGCNDVRLQERLLREPDLTLCKAINICRAAEATKEQIRTIKSASGTATAQTVNEVQKHRSVKQEKSTCQKCGTTHSPRSCPAYGKQCNWCSGWSHYEVMCYKKRSESSAQQLKPQQKSVNRGRQVQRRSDRGRSSLRRGQRSASRDVNALTENTENQLYVGVIGVNSVTESEKTWYKELMIEVHPISCKLDCGAEANIISKQTYNSLHTKQRIRPSDTVLTTFGAWKIKPLGVVRLAVMHNYSQFDVDFYVTDFDAVTLIGLPTSIQLARSDKMSR